MKIRRPGYTKQTLAVAGAVIAMGTGAFGCGEDEETETAIVDTESDSDTGTVPVAPQWAVEMIQDMDAGIQTQLVLGPLEELGLAWFDIERSVDGSCDDITTPTTRYRHTIYYASKAGTDEPWILEEVENPAVIAAPTGLSLAFNPEGEPTIAFAGGDPGDYWCGGSDAMLATRMDGVWQTETASTMSGDSNSGLVGSDEGDVVGLWPALSYSASGEPAIVHKDVHFGTLQSIDQRKSDAEFAWRRGGSWTHEYIDANEGAGDYNALVFDGDTPIAFYVLPVEVSGESRKGVWAARRAADGAWDERVKLHSGSTYHEIAAGINPVTKELVVAFYSAEEKAVRVRRLTNLTNFSVSSAWTSEIVSNALYDEGRYVSLAFTPKGKDVLAFHRCKMNSSTSDSCDQNDEAAILAIRNGGKWTMETIVEGNNGSCGEYTSVVVDAKGVAHVVYRCTETDGSEYFFRLFLASREIEAQ